MSALKKEKQPIMSEQFKMYVDELNGKIAIAVEAMKEVNRIKELAGLPALINNEYTRESFERPAKTASEGPYDWYDRVSEMFNLVKKGGLESEFEKAGWSTSSSYC